MRALVLPLALLAAAPALAQPLAIASLDPQEGGYFGWAVSAVPDADGRADFLVGEHIAAGIGPGRAYLFSGASGARLHTLQSPNPELYGSFGLALAVLPDVTGDGRAELLVGAPYEDDTNGRAYVFNGRTGRRRLTAAVPGARGFGNGVAGLEDVDGDGRGDAVVGAPFGERAYLYRSGSGIGAAWAGEDVDAAVALATGGPPALALAAAPNPFAGATTLRVGLPRPSAVTVEVLDVLGRRVALLHDGALGAGAHEIAWAPPGDVPGGVYLVRLRVEGEPAQIHRVTLAR